MAADKTIPELPAQLPQLSDLLIGDDGIITYKFTEVQLLALLQANLSVGSVFTFSTGVIPSNTVGNNGDVYWKQDTGQIAQKLSNVWTVVYTITPGAIGSTIFYGSVAPTTQGINGDTYLLTTNGTFYNKVSGSWVAKFSMATGPVGPAGANGANGTNGTNGFSVLNGTTNPSNLSDGVDGDFFVNTTTYNMFGPKAGGTWPAGFSLIGPPASALPPIITAITSGVTPTPLTVAYNQVNYPYPDYVLLRGSDGSVDWNTKVVPVYNPVSGSASFEVFGDSSDGTTWAENYTFIIKP